MSAFIEFGGLVQDVVSSASTSADQRRRETRTKVYRQMPNSAMKNYPLTKTVLSNNNEPVQNPKFEFAFDKHDAFYTNPTGAYTDSGLSSAVGASVGTAAGTTIYLKMVEADAKQAVPYEQVQVRLHHKTSDSDAKHEAFMNVRVVSTTLNGASSYVVVKTMEDDTGNVLGGLNSANYNKYSIPIATAMPEGSGLPWGRYREVTEHYNYSQIFMQGLGLTGTELSNAQRFGNDEQTYVRYWRQVHDRFNAQLERALMWGVRDKQSVTFNLGNGNQVVDQYSTGGIYWMMKNLGNPDNIINIRNVTTFDDYDFTGKEWTESGYDFLCALLLRLAQKSRNLKQMYLSDQALLSITRMFEAMTNVQVDTKHKNAWGFQVTKIYGLTSELELILHTDLCCNPAWQRVALILEPDVLRWRTKQGRDMTLITSAKDLKDKAKVEAGHVWRDMIQEGIVMDGGLEVGNLDGCAIVTGLGRNFAAAA